MARKTKLENKEALLQAIAGSYGIISTIADKLGVNWNTARNYIKSDGDAMALYESERNRILDKAESAVVDALEKMDLQTAKWILSVKGKDRGYTGTDSDTLDDKIKLPSIFCG